jgi:D-beta-D-heptose 7-phosphate kinase/D-beta-D-heptose 1-phosphate adenosyltransferase
VVHSLETGFHNRKVLVLGDLMLDRYLWGDASRLSPEAPVPVVRFVAETKALGGAGNVALNLAKLGLSVAVGGLVGDDESGASLLHLLSQAGIDTAAVKTLPGRPTVTKTRIIGGHHQMLRLDVEDLTPVPDAALTEITAKFEPALSEGLAAVVLSDYKKGALAAPLCQEVIGSARRRGIPVLVDPKGRAYTKYSGATGLSPNRLELAEVTGVPPTNLNALLAAGGELRRTLELEFLAVTLGEQGIALLEPSQARHFPAMAREVFEVSGAGDTVIATMAAGLVAGLDRADTIRLANLAAGIVVGKSGTVPVERTELLDLLSSHPRVREVEKVCSLETLVQRAAAWRARRERIVFTNGCFDILHAGHVTYLEAARQEGHRLVVGLNSDPSVRALKGTSRPIMREADRARLLAALACVDAVVLFDEDTPLNLILALRPDVLVKGGDYREEDVVGAPQVESWGGRVLCLPLVEGLSTTTIINRISRSLVSRDG